MTIFLTTPDRGRHSDLVHEKHTGETKVTYLRPSPQALAISIMILASLSISSLSIAHAQTISPNACPCSVDLIANPGFESPLTNAPPGWQGDIYDDGNYHSTVTINNTIAHTGLSSARLDLSANYTAIKTNITSNEFHITLLQYLQPANLMFSNLTNRPDSLSLWFLIQPKFSGYAAWEIRIRAGSTSELDYVYSNPAVGFGFGNSTTGSEGGKPLDEIMMPAPTLNQWIHLSRNLKSDWTSPIKLPSGTFVPGLNASDAFQRIEADAIYYKNTSATGNVYAETAWVDDFAVYADSSTPDPNPPPPTNYYASPSFQDANGNPVNNLVKWKLFNSTGYQVVGYTGGSPSLLLEPYTVEVYYPTFIGQTPEPYAILRQRITLNITELVALQMYPQLLQPWVYVALNSTLSQPIKVTNETPGALQFTAKGNNGPYMITVNVTSRPVAVQRNNQDPTTINWTYDSALSLLRIPTSGLGNFSIFTTAPLTVPSVTFQDISGNAITSNLSWRVLDPNGSPLTVLPGQLVPTGSYTFETLYEGYQIYRNGLTATPSILRLQMMPLVGQTKGYVAFNAPVNSISVLENGPDQLQFSATGTGSYLVVANVLAKPVSIQQDGNTISTWTYNSTTGTVAIQASSLGTFTISYSQSPAIPLLYLAVGIGIGVLALATVGIYYAQKRMRSGNSNVAPVAQSPPKQELKPKNKKPPASR